MQDCINEVGVFHGPNGVHQMDRLLLKLKQLKLKHDRYGLIPDRIQGISVYGYSIKV